MLRREGGAELSRHHADRLRALAGVRHGRSLAAVGRTEEDDPGCVGQGNLNSLAYDRFCGDSETGGRGDADAEIPLVGGIARDRGAVPGVSCRVRRLRRDVRSA